MAPRASKRAAARRPRRGRLGRGGHQDGRFDDSRTAVRQEVVTTSEGLGPAGQRAVRYVIDGGPDRAVIATTFDVEGNDFAHSVEVLDAMAAALEVDPRDPGAGG